MERADCVGFEVWREGGRTNGRLNTGSVLFDVEARGPGFGMPLTRRFEGATEARLGFDAAEAVGVVLERESEILDVFFCKVGAGAGWLGRDMEDTDGFLRSCSVEAGARSWDWLPVDLSTGSRELAGLGMPDGRGMADGWSMMDCYSSVGSLRWLWARPFSAQAYRVDSQAQSPLCQWTNCAPMCTPRPTWSLRCGMSERRSLVASLPSATSSRQARLEGKGQ